MNFGSERFSTHESRQGNNIGTHENDKKELLSPYQTRKGVALKKWKRIRRDSNSSNRVRFGNCNSDFEYLPGPDFENIEDWKAAARAPKVRHVRDNWKNICDSKNMNGNNGECGVSGDEDEENSDGNLCWQVEEEKEERNFEDPLIESICSFRAAQEALERELKKFREIGNESFSHSFSPDDDDDSTKCSNTAAEASAVDIGFHESCISSQLQVKQISPSSLELQVLSLTKNISILESKSEELRGMLALKDSRIAELEKIALSGDKFPKEESTCSIDLLDEKFKEVESELESLYRQRVEAEVEYLAITKMMQNLKVASAFTLLEKQETRFRSQMRVPNKLEEKSKLDELEKHCGDILGVEEAFMVQKRVCKLTFCLFLQFMLLILVFWLAVSQLLPNSGVVVPT